jgi:hypothetical protein
MTVDPITPPANISYGTVVFQAAGVHIDDSDVGTTPDFNAATGTVTFTATQTMLRDGSAAPNPITLFPRPVVGVLGADGYLTTPGGGPAYPGVSLIATDDPDLEPVDLWAWFVEFNLKDAFGIQINIEPFYILVPAGATVDLTTADHIDPTTLEAIPPTTSQWKQYIDDGDAAVSAGAAAALATEITNRTADVDAEEAARIAADATKQPLDADLTDVAALDSSTSGMIASDGAGWIKKTYGQVKTALGLTKADVGLGDVDNTSDVDKPISTAQQGLVIDSLADGDTTHAPSRNVVFDAIATITAALTGKAPLASPTFTGTPTAPTPTAGDDDTSVATTEFVQGEIATAIGDFGLRQIVKFTANGTFTKATYPWLRYVRVRLVGGGGAGGGSSAHTNAQVSGGSGGAGGGYSEKVIDVDTLGANETVTIGAGGTAVTGAGGGGGGTTSFGTHLQATGGAGGTLAGASGGAGPLAWAQDNAGVGSNGDINLKGDPGHGMSAISGSFVGGEGGIGGGSRLGPPSAPAGGGSVPAAAGNNYGGAGSAPRSSGGLGAGAAKPGGNGAPGIVIVELYG